MLNLMYHYIFPKSFEKSLNGIKFTSQEKFRKQIIKLKKKYTFINPEELNDIDTRSINKNLCSVTFDDGTKDQFKYAIPVLNEFNRNELLSKKIKLSENMKYSYLISDQLCDM